MASSPQLLVKRAWRQGLLLGFAIGLGITLVPWAIVNRPRPYVNEAHPAPPTKANAEANELPQNKIKRPLP